MEHILLNFLLNKTRDTFDNLLVSYMLKFRLSNQITLFQVDWLRCAIVSDWRNLRGSAGCRRINIPEIDRFLSDFGGGIRFDATVDNRLFVLFLIEIATTLM